MEALMHLHDLDWLDTSRVAEHPMVLGRVNPADAMGRGQALRRLLLYSLERTLAALSDIPGYEGVVGFLRGYQKRQPVTTIAEQLGVRRENVFRYHRPKALRLVARSFLELLGNLETGVMRTG